jgi:hypothetical protein
MQPPATNSEPLKPNPQFPTTATAKKSKRSFFVVVLTLLASTVHAQTPTATAPVPVARFVGTWVGTQAWAIPNPPPGASNDQPVTLELQLVDGKLTGTMKPFLGGDDGATIVDATIVGDELHANAVVGRPRPANAGRRGGGAGASTIRIAFVFRNDGLNMTGTADLQMGEVPWTKFSYKLGKKRSRYQ